MKLLKKTAFAALAAGALALAGGGPGYAKDFYKMGTLGPGTSAFLTMSTMATIVNQALDDVEIQVNATGAATKHQIDAARGKMDFFMTAPTIALLMKNGKAMYAKLEDAPQLYEKLRLIYWFPLGLYHITAYADSGIVRLEDIKGKRVFLGPPGGGAWVTSRNLVRGATGLEPEKDFENVKLGWTAAQQAFLDRRIDVYINPTNAPSPVIEQIAASNKIRFLPVTDEHMAREAVQKATVKRPGGTIGMIKAGTYGANQVNEADVRAMGSIVGVGTNERMDADKLYEITRAFWEGIEGMRANTPWMRNINLETALLDGPLPLHEGAARYYREIGLEIPQGLMPKP